jgi:hypothetical protein
MDMFQALRAQNFTTGAIAIIRQLRERAAARDISLSKMLPEILLWTILRWERTIAIVALEDIGINCWNFQMRLDELIRTKDPHESVAHPVMIACDWAAHEALLMGCDYKGSEHLLLGAVSAADLGLRTFLTQYELTYETVKEKVVSILHRAI